MWGQHVYYIIRSHDQKSPVAPHSDYLDPRNVLVPLMMLLALYNVDASTNSVTWPETSCCISFQLS